MGDIMSRPFRKRRVCCKPKYNEFQSKNGNDEFVRLSLEEYEVIRLIDYENLTQEECASRMNVARTTVTSLYQDARSKIADCIINGKILIIDGGNYELCPNTNICNGYNCKYSNIQIIERKENVKMRIAVTYENGNVFQHFGRCPQFKIYDLDAVKGVTTFILDSNGAGHGALAGLLASNQVDILICGGAGGGAISALQANGIAVCAGVTGNADEAVRKLINDELVVNNASNCNHHDHEEGHECHCSGHHEEGIHECHCHNEEK